jgi:hypothetical protein
VPARLAAPALAAALLSPALADGACQPLIDAMIKFAATPSHGYVSGAGVKAAEMIRTGGALYVLTKGKWITVPLDPEEEMSDLKEKLGASSSATCAAAPGETVEGQPTQVYTAHTVTEDVTSDSKTWVATATGLPVRQEIRTDDGRVRSIRFDYANVAAPAGAVDLQHALTRQK